jgi:hypothetical protein
MESSIKMDLKEICYDGRSAFTWLKGDPVMDCCEYAIEISDHGKRRNFPLSVEPLTDDSWSELTNRWYVSETAVCRSRARQHSKYSSNVTCRMLVVDIHSVYLSVLFRPNN